jgi:hypothetical protein
MQATPRMVVTRRPVPRKALVGTLVLCVLGGVGFWFGSRAGGTAEGGGFPLIVQDSDFGEAFMQEDFRWQLPFRNVSDRPVEVIGFRFSCLCLSIEPNSFVVPAGAARSVDLVLDTSGNWREGDVDQLRDFSVDLWPVIGGANQSMDRWVVTGRVRRPLEFSPPAVLYGEALVEGEPLPETTVLVRAADGVERLALHCDWPSVQVDAAPARARGPGWFELRLLAGEQPASPGRFEVDLQVTGVLAEGEELPAVPLRLAGVVVPAFYTIPHVLRLPVASQEQPASADLVLQSRVDGEFEVEQVLISEGGLVIEPERSALAREHAFRVICEQRASEPGERMVSFIIRSNCGERKHVEVRVVQVQ